MTRPLRQWSWINADGRMTHVQERIRGVWSMIGATVAEEREFMAFTLSAERELWCDARPGVERAA